MAQTSSSVLDELRSHLSGDTVNQISQKIGADPEHEADAQHVEP